ncbi:alpha/beta hydrolase [Solemya velum gill symbiont]|uniref:AB hydrolase-1 domain-containing protein n=1 Tax=Solemya velum gill symbiont TaxID=2340 RepID=A0A0B0H778_SOVGS|nr:alpha/beta fold hydrolase [Solemya velum gill symbiont]KHF26048.1 hypothetical protein JV46_14120 [Solemya velum gill symbiont]OOY49666.1 hypothetical protein BOV97_12620 [Solemya velum gill symbiont]OOY54155.1 hypothetical protein BOV99_12025 [Solemya velum gill symbiont]OOY54223.1 hypothetical protein BOW00_12030 [Solemya velum gill symbiont]OOY58937.1 hypothetical protein BOW02_11995 [Solemya velum gill symbiont]
MRTYQVLHPAARELPNQLSRAVIAKGHNKSVAAVAPRFCQLDHRPEVRYFEVLPDTIDRNTPVVVVVHGISRHAREYASIFSGLASSGKAILIAPLFDDVKFNGYQRPGLAKTSVAKRSDNALNDILKNVQDEYGVDTSRIHLFGFSGGAQFSQRYALFYPQRVERLVLAAPGWFTMPDEKYSYPYGLGQKLIDTNLKFRFNETLSIPTLLLSGGDDIYRDAGLNKTARIDRRQGMTRLERAYNWEKEIRASADEINQPILLEHEVIADAGHNFIDNVRRYSVDHLIEEFLFRKPKETE